MSEDMRDVLPQAPFEHPDCPDCSNQSGLYESIDCWCVPLFYIDRLKAEIKDTRHMFLRLTQIVKTVLPMLNTKEFLELGKLFAEFEAGNV